MKLRADRFQTPPPGRSFFRCWLTVAWLSLAPVVAMHGATLNWTPSTDSAVAGFKIYYGPSSQGYTNSLVVGKVNSTTISGLVAKATYYLVVTALDNVGHESAFSGEISFTVPAPVSSNSGVPANTPSSNVAVKNTPTPTASPVSAPKPPSNPVTTPVAKFRPQNTPASKSPSVTTAPKSNPSLANATTGSPTKSPATPAAIVAKANSNPASMVASVQLPTASAKHSVSAAQPSPQTTVVSEAATALAGKAAAFYAAAAAFDANSDRVLNAPEKDTLIKALVGGTTEIFGSQKQYKFSDDEAPDVVAWMAVLYSQMAAFDLQKDGRLNANEQAALAVALEKGDLALPLFAPLMLSEDPENPMCP